MNFFGSIVQFLEHEYLFHPLWTFNTAQIGKTDFLRLVFDCFFSERCVSSSWGVPLTITTAAVSLSKIGYDASEVSVGWCWVRIQAQDRVLWMLLTGKIWEFLAYVTLPILYILIKRHIHVAVRTEPVPLFLSVGVTLKCTFTPSEYINIRIITYFLTLWLLSSKQHFMVSVSNSRCSLQRSTLPFLSTVPFWPTGLRPRPFPLWLM